jgi:hypothetical protein
MLIRTRVLGGTTVFCVLDGIARELVLMIRDMSRSKPPKAIINNGSVASLMIHVAAAYR